jgi:hypothetical protein
MKRCNTKVAFLFKLIREVVRRRNVPLTPLFDFKPHWQSPPSSDEELTGNLV